MSFGTAHHPTTYLMIQQMRTINFKGKRILDFGTGTGILAILSSNLGGREIIAIDNDDLSIENAIENVTTNSCNNILVSKKDTTAKLEKFDIILANINLNVLLENFAILKQNLFPTGQLLLSGILETDFNTIYQKCLMEGFQLKEKVMREGWLCILLNI